jgi:DNA-binding XRE family transcriptional regulator
MHRLSFDPQHERRLFCTIQAGALKVHDDEIRCMRSHQDPALLSAFAAELKARRAALGLSQEGLAFASGVNRTFVAKLELGDTSPSLTSVFRLAKGLQAEAWEIILSLQARYEKELRATR